MFERPMLGVNAGDISLLKLPLLASFKLDGIRARCSSGTALSRTMKPIKNKFVQNFFETYAKELQGYDGELIVGKPYGEDVLNRTVKGVMKVEGEPDFRFHVFDRFDLNEPFMDRIQKILRVTDRVAVVPQNWVGCVDDITEFEASAVGQGYEGIILRNPYGLYKQGRSTLAEAGLLKVKQFDDAEAEIVGFKEKLHNANEATLDERGFTKRSTHQINKTGLNTLGAFVCKGIGGVWEDVKFDVGSGMNDTQRKEFWENRVHMLGKALTYKYFTVGCKDRPRHPIFKAIRDEGEL